MADIPDILNVTAVIATSIILGYVAFWALTVRRALLVPIYRRQALGTALIAILAALTTIVNTAVAYLYLGGAFGALGEGAFGVWFVLLFILFYWVDSSVIAVRRSDPRARDTLHWSRVRKPLWALAGSGVMLVVGVSIFGVITTGFAAQASSSAPGPSGPLSLTLLVDALVTVLLISAIFIPIVSAAVMLPIIARRTADLTFRAQLIWFGAFSVLYLVFEVLLTNQEGLFPNEWYNLSICYIGLAVCAYCLYRSVSALIPTYRAPVVAGAQPGSS